MPFKYQLSDELKEVLKKLSKREPQTAEAIYKKIKQITEQNDETTIEHFKNLKHGLSEYKRVHIGNFVLLFRVFKEENLILFVKFGHHDDIYR